MPNQRRTAKTARISTGNTGPKVYTLRNPPSQAIPINIQNKLYAGTEEGHRFEWYKFDLVDPVYWHVTRDPPPTDLTDHVEFQSGDRLTTDPNEGSPLFIPLYKYEQCCFVANMQY